MPKSRAYSWDTDDFSYQYLKCDVTSWQDQLAVFRAAIARSPQKSLDVVIANAGIGGNDSVFQLGSSVPTMSRMNTAEELQTTVMSPPSQC